jgi:uncharacterized protein (TIGR00730 family)
MPHWTPVIGVIPKGLRKLAHERLSELRVVDSMHERKATMFDLADGVIALPGGIGTIEEVLEVITWAQLGLHAKPCGLLNVCGYYDRLLEFLDHAVDQQFVTPEHRQMIPTRCSNSSGVSARRRWRRSGRTSSDLSRRPWETP